MNKKKYVPPGVEIYRVLLETGIAVETSIEEMSATAQAWDYDDGIANTVDSESDIFVAWY
jgi:hypothetical protein